ncbi:Uncharacterised protein [Metamycoplasma alkalescens]|uniref:Uncharacterized protein n=4 Tax=Metamycoplasma alkalescens TaxID=45363 RepID=A0A3B0PM84_9BACT|nr:Uncharacterised protein [Metamycoplasma alkalescens]
MPLTILSQFSQLYTYIPNDSKFKALIQGGSGSMVIDSSFNLIGIVNTHATDEKNETNGINLFQSISSDYKENTKPNIMEDLRKKLQSDKIQTIKLNPNKV